IKLARLSKNARRRAARFMSPEIAGGSQVRAGDGARRSEKAVIEFLGVAPRQAPDFQAARDLVGRGAGFESATTRTPSVGCWKNGCRAYGLVQFPMGLVTSAVPPPLVSHTG